MKLKFVGILVLLFYVYIVVAGRNSGKHKVVPEASCDLVLSYGSEPTSPASPVSQTEEARRVAWSDEEVDNIEGVHETLRIKKRIKRKIDHIFVGPLYKRMLCLGRAVHNLYSCKLFLSYDVIQKLSSLIKSLLDRYPDDLVSNVVIDHLMKREIAASSFEDLYLLMVKKGIFRGRKSLKKAFEIALIKMKIPLRLDQIIKGYLDRIEYVGSLLDKEDALRKINHGYLPLSKVTKEKMVEAIRKWLAKCSADVVSDVVVKFVMDRRIYPYSIEVLADMLQPINIHESLHSGIKYLRDELRCSAQRLRTVKEGASSD